MKKNLIARKSNYLIEASYKLSLSQLRITYLGISKLFYKKPLSLQRTQRIYAKEYAEVFGVDISVAYKHVADASDELLRTVITTQKNADGTLIKNNRKKKHQWLSQAIYSDKEGFVDITFHEEMGQYLTVLSKRYAELNFERLHGVQSVYTARLWELLIQYKKDGERFIMMDDFRKWFQLEKKYKMYSDLKKRIINPAINELEEKANLIISWDEIKKGRKVVGFDFMFEENKQMELFK
jgi:plasmid replication initiation protein